MNNERSILTSNNRLECHVENQREILNLKIRYSRRHEHRADYSMNCVTYFLHSFLDCIHRRRSTACISSMTRTMSLGRMSTIDRSIRSDEKSHFSLDSFVPDRRRHVTNPCQTLDYYSIGRHALVDRMDSYDAYLERIRTTI
jgi:hypothetical protein